ncbi:hypothetical protein DK26_15140 [Bosea sp. WAO]|uniref:hypothetical protein n=1 Tax=Bosea sp. WAO TaxID=406341 RepID=UPI00074B0BE0|nr:hypothetical protein [Bosea sp. WAO]KUL94341.1 hypothetical protein DK26_15140 [Bosea sp. WAO]
MATIFRTQNDYEKAIIRIQQLSTRSPATVLDTSELRALLGAADDWDRLDGGEAAGERSTSEVLARETGSGFALWMARRFAGQDWVADLANMVGESRSYVEQHLQHDTMPPADLVAAALRLASSEPVSGETANKAGLAAPSN